MEFNFEKLGVYKDKRTKKFAVEIVIRFGERTTNNGERTTMNGQR